MKNKKVYNLDIMNILKTEINNLKDHKKQELTLDKILLQARKDVADLIEMNCSAQEIATIFNKSGIKVGINRIKKLYFTSAIKRKTNQSSKINPLVKE